VKSISIPVPPDFSFSNTVISHGWYHLAPFRWDAESRTLHRTETFDGSSAIDLKISFDGSLVVSWRQGRLIRAGIKARIRRMFQLDLDLGEFHALCASTPTHRAAGRARFGRLLCGSTRFEDAVKIIATTNTTWKQTTQMVRLLAETCGPPSPSGAHAFPSPENLSWRSEVFLREVCRLGYRSRYVLQLAQGITEGKIDLDAIPSQASGTDELFAAYRTLPGIGPYGAAHLLAMEGRHDRIAVDTEFRRFVREEYHGGRTVKDATMLGRYKRWGRWQYLAYWSLTVEAIERIVRGRYQIDAIVYSGQCENGILTRGVPFAIMNSVRMIFQLTENTRLISQASVQSDHQKSLGRQDQTAAQRTRKRDQ